MWTSIGAAKPSVTATEAVMASVLPTMVPSRRIKAMTAKCIFTFYFYLCLA